MQDARYSEPSSVDLYVYFIQAEEGGPVKIGKSSSPADRLNDLQVSHHQTLVLRAIVPDPTGTLERKLHDAFARQRIRGEWFTPTPLMVECGSVRLDDAAPSSAEHQPALPPLPALVSPPPRRPASRSRGRGKSPALRTGNGGEHCLDLLLAFHGSPAEAASRFTLPMNRVRDLRVENRRDPETGVPWLWPGDKPAALAQAVRMVTGPPAHSIRRAEERTGVPSTTLRRHLRKCAQATTVWNTLDPS